MNRADERNRALAAVSNELRVAVALALAVVAPVATSMTRAIPVSSILPRVVFAIRVVLCWIRTRVTASDFHELDDAGDRGLHPL